MGARANHLSPLSLLCITHCAPENLGTNIPRARTPAIHPRFEVHPDTPTHAALRSLRVDALANWANCLSALPSSVGLSVTTARTLYMTLPAGGHSRLGALGLSAEGGEGGRHNPPPHSRPLTIASPPLRRCHRDAPPSSSRRTSRRSNLAASRRIFGWRSAATPSPPANYLRRASPSPHTS